jgi:hypothetical protein
VSLWRSGSIAGTVRSAREDIPRTRTGEVDERRRGWKKCACLIHASRTLARQYNRRQTAKFIWDEGKAVAAAWVAVGSWDGKLKPAPEPPAPVSRRITIADGTQVFLALREGDKTALATVHKYKTFTKQLLAFAASRGFVMLDQLTTADMGRFYGGLKLGVRAKTKRLGTQWIVAACDALGKIKCMNDQGHGAWTGEDAKNTAAVLLSTNFNPFSLFGEARKIGNPSCRHFVHGIRAA